MNKPLVLCIAQDDNLGSNIKRFVGAAAVRLQFCQTPAGALSALAEEPVFVILIDYHSLAADASALLQVLREASPMTQLVGLCAHENLAFAIEDLGVGLLDGIIAEPLSGPQVQKTVYRAVAQAVLDRLGQVLPEVSDRFAAENSKNGVIARIRDVLIDTEIYGWNAISQDLHLTAGAWQLAVFAEDAMRRRLDAMVTVFLRLATSHIDRVTNKGSGSVAQEYDDLSGVFGRAGLDEALSREVERADRYGSALAVLLLDVDGFGAINKRFGRQTGDRIIKGLGNVLDGLTRRTDVIGRLSNDDFCILLPGLSVKDAVLAARRIQREVASWVNAAMHDVPLTLSFGVAIHERGAKSGDPILQRATVALDHARKAGTGNISTNEGAAELA